VSQRARLGAVGRLVACGAALLGLLPPAALAHGGVEGVAIVRACGLNGCRAVEPLELFHAVDRPLRPGWPVASSQPPPTPGSYYELRTRYGGEPAFFAPASGLYRGDTDPFGWGDRAWLRLEPRVERSLRRWLRDLRPFPSPRLETARIGDRLAGNPQRYLAAYRKFPLVADRSSEPARAVSIELRSGELSPWTDGYNSLRYVRATRLLYRDGELVRPSQEVVRLLEHVDPAGTSVPVALLLGTGLPACLLLAGVAVLRVRLSSRLRA
jgi:hypothetical protein